MKRTHSPSPPPPASPYHAGYGYKPPPSIPTYNPPPPSMYLFIFNQKVFRQRILWMFIIFLESEDAARRSGDSRAVLWNSKNIKKVFLNH